MIRFNLKQKILNLLDQPPWLVKEDFEVQSSRVDDGATLRINFIAGDPHFFEAKIPLEKEERDGLAGYKSEEFLISISCSLGELTKYGTLETWGGPGLLREVKAWVERLAEELQSAPLARAIERQESLVDEIEERLAAFPDDVATAEQLESLRTSMEAIQKELEQRITSLSKNDSERARQLEELRRELEALKTRAEGMSVRSLMRACAVRLYRFASSEDTSRMIDNGRKVLGLIGDGESASSVDSGA